MSNEKQQPVVKLVTAPARTLETKASLARPNPYTTDWTDMAELTRQHVSSRKSWKF